MDMKLDTKTSTTTETYNTIKINFEDDFDIGTEENTNKDTYEPKTDLTWITKTNPKTQKAKSLFVITKGYNTSRLARSFPSVKIEPLIITSKLPLSAFDVTKNIKLNEWLKLKCLHTFEASHRQWFLDPNIQIMARPCPLKPRHGFVESRVVKTVKCLYKVVKETREADPLGEVLLMPFIEEAKYSAVITDSGVTIGPSNDGATSGKDSIFIPCAIGLKEFISTLPCVVRTNGAGKVGVIPANKYLGLHVKNRGTYIESVNSQCVQIRYGPQVDGATKVWSKHETIYVTKVWKPDSVETSNFTYIESKIKELSAKGGSVVYLPQATLSSHVAVQAISSGVSVITGDAPEPLEKNYYNFSKLTPAHASINPWLSIPQLHSKLKFVFQYGGKLELQLYKARNYLPWAIAIIQGMAGVPDSQLRANCMLIASCILIRYGIGACLGEHRRYFCNGPGRNVLGISSISRLDGSLEYKYVPNSGPMPTGRSNFQGFGIEYNIADTKKVFAIIGKLTLVEHMFAKGGWDTGFGGQPWADCTRRVLDLYKATLEAVNTDYPETFSSRCMEIVRAANAFITVCHNGGRCLTKYIGGELMNDISRYPSPFLANELSITVAKLSSTPQNKEEEEDGI